MAVSLGFYLKIISPSAGSQTLYFTDGTTTITLPSIKVGSEKQYNAGRLIMTPKIDLGGSKEGMIATEQIMNTQLIDFIKKLEKTREELTIEIKTEMYPTGINLIAILQEMPDLTGLGLKSTINFVVLKEI